MRLTVPVIFSLAILLSPCLAMAQGEKDPIASIHDELKTLSRKVDELKAQNKAIQETQAQILKEIDILKIRIRRSG
ncbi:MAG: hypothetical protein A2036_02605 [Omnitrophica bacterium GWA2_50_21]|nr:MAG: hypothetical protein A2036_02605 [Omnitrophica bacterium GWA2_50_21]